MKANHISQEIAMEWDSQDCWCDSDSPLVPRRPTIGGVISFRTVFFLPYLVYPSAGRVALYSVDLNRFWIWPFIGLVWGPIKCKSSLDRVGLKRCFIRVAWYPLIPPCPIFRYLIRLPSDLLPFHALVSETLVVPCVRSQLGVSSDFFPPGQTIQGDILYKEVLSSFFKRREDKDRARKRWRVSFGLNWAVV